MGVVQKESIQDSDSGPQQVFSKVRAVSQHLPREEVLEFGFQACLHLTLLASDQRQGLRGRSRVTSGGDQPSWPGQQGNQTLALEWKPAGPVAFTFLHCRFHSPGPGAAQESFSHSGVLSHLPTWSHIWGEQPVVRPCVPALDSENTMTMGIMQRMSLKSEDMTSRPVNMGKDYITVLSLSFL